MGDETFYPPELTFARLRVANIARLQRWHGDTADWSGADWANAMQGESGEAGNVVKKLRRHETGLGDSANTQPKHVLIDMLGEELADTIIYADLLAQFYGIDLTQAVIGKFNKVSIRNGFPERL